MDNRSVMNLISSFYSSHFQSTNRIFCFLDSLLGCQGNLVMVFGVCVAVRIRIHVIFIMSNGPPIGDEIMIVTDIGGSIIICVGFKTFSSCCCSWYEQSELIVDEQISKSFYSAIWKAGSSSLSATSVDPVINQECRQDGCRFLFYIWCRNKIQWDLIAYNPSVSVARIFWK